MLSKHFLLLKAISEHREIHFVHKPNILLTKFKRVQLYDYYKNIDGEIAVWCYNNVSKRFHSYLVKDMLYIRLGYKFKFSNVSNKNIERSLFSLTDSNPENPVVNCSISISLLCKCYVLILLLPLDSFV